MNQESFNENSCACCLTRLKTDERTYFTKDHRDKIQELLNNEVNHSKIYKNKIQFKFFILGREL